MKNILFTFLFLTFTASIGSAQEDKLDTEIRRLMENKQVGKVPAWTGSITKSSNNDGWGPSGGLQLERVDFIRTGIKLADDEGQNRLEKLGRGNQRFKETIVPLKRYRVVDRKKYLRWEAFKNALMPGALLGAVAGGVGGVIHVSILDLKSPPRWNIFNTKARFALLGKWLAPAAAIGAAAGAWFGRRQAAANITHGNYVYEKGDPIETKSAFVNGYLVPEERYWFIIE